MRERERHREKERKRKKREREREKYEIVTVVLRGHRACSAWRCTGAERLRCSGCRDVIIVFVGAGRAGVELCRRERERDDRPARLSRRPPNLPPAAHGTPGCRSLTFLAMSPSPPSASAPAADPAEVTAAAPASPRAGAAGGSGSRAADDVARLISRLQAAIASVPPSPPLPEEQIRPEQAQGSRGSTNQRPATATPGSAQRAIRPVGGVIVLAVGRRVAAARLGRLGAAPAAASDAAGPSRIARRGPGRAAGGGRGRVAPRPPFPPAVRLVQRRSCATAAAEEHPAARPDGQGSPAAAAEGGAARVPLPPKPSSPADADAPDGGEAGASGDADQLLQRITELERRLRDKTEEVESLTCDLDAVSKKCVEHVGKLAEVQHSKDEAENELEDLSRQLFETANGMVADAARARHQLEGAHRTLQAKFDETQEALSNERSQLRELKRRMEEMSAEHGEDRGGSGFQSRRGSQDIIHRRSLSDLTGLRDRKVPAAQGANEDGLSADIPRIPPPDEAVIQEFEMFVRLLPDTPLRRLHSLPFLRHCLEEEVDCCLRFMPTSRLTTRRLVDAIVNNTCSIEDAPTSTPAT
ncbi:MAG: hypothetical protein BJ554DRAFT_5119, partial [Olpidium bornovanus]